MSRVKTQESQRGRQRSPSYRTEFNQEIDQRIAQLRERISQVRDLTVDGFPYKDSERVRLEMQIRQSIRQAFGDGSPEFQKHQYFRLKIASQGEIDATIAMLQDFIVRIEKQKFDLPDDSPRSSASPLPEQHGEPLVENRSEAARPPAAARPAPVKQEPPAVVPAPPVPEPLAVPTASQPSAQPEACTAAPLPSSTPTPSAPPSASSEGPPAAQPSAPLPAEAAQAPVSQNPSSNGHPARSSGDSPMVSHKSRNDGTDTLLREPRPESWNPDDRSARGSIRKLCTGFHAVARQLRQRHEDRSTLDVEDEHDVQDLLHAILRLEFEDIRTEHWVPSYAGGAERTTFLFLPEAIALVIKRTKPGLGGREIRSQLEIDAQRYSGRPDCATLFCFVYDPEGRIANPREFEEALTQESEAGSIAVQISP